MYPVDIRVVLVGVEGSVNLGSVARLCKNFGIERLYLVNPATSIDEEAYRYAMRGRDVLERAVVLGSLDEVAREVDLVACTSSVVPVDRDLLRQPIELRDFIEVMRGYRSVAVVFGRESTGLTRRELEKCHVYVHIAASREYPVLNLSHAVAIVLYEIFREYGEKRSTDMIETPTREDYEVLERVLRRAVEKAMPRDRAEEAYVALRRLVFKARPTSTEARLLARVLGKLARYEELREVSET